MPTGSMVEYGPTFRNLEQMYLGNTGEAIAFIPIDFAFGLLQGWWDPLIQERAGFSGIDVEMAEQEELECRYSSIIGRISGYSPMKARVAKAILPHQLEERRLPSAVPFSLQIREFGHVDTAEWAEISEEKNVSGLGENEVLVEVQTIGLTMRDYLIASGQLNETNLGTDLAGIILEAGKKSGLKPGQRVCVLHCGQGHSRIRVPSGAVSVFPDEMTFTEAASLPSTLWLAYHALINVARLEEGETVLIYHGHSCVGQIAAQIAKHLGATVLVTTTSAPKRQFLRNELHLPESSILCADRSDFPSSLQRATDGKGIDVIIGPSSGDLLRDVTKYLGPFGRLVNFDSNHRHQMFSVGENSSNVSISSISMMNLLKERPARALHTFQASIQFALGNHLKPPGPIHSFSAQKPVVAFAHFQEEGAFGKRVIEIGPDLCIRATVLSTTKYQFPADGTYVIAGGLGGLGRSFARWMVSRGARNLLLLSRSGAQSQEAKLLVDELQQQGVYVLTPAVDISESGDLIEVIESVKNLMPPIRGCIQAAVALRDNLFENMTYEDWTTSTNAKVTGSSNLHAALPRGLDFFILLSSVNGIFGGRAQANYAAGNTFKDALAHYRIDQGQKAVSIDLSLMVTEGVVAENDFLLASMRRIGHLMDIQQEELLTLLDYHCDANLPLLSHDDAQVMVGIELPAAVLDKDTDLHHSIRRHIFRHLFRMASSSMQVTQVEPSGTRVNRATTLRKANTQTEAMVLVTHWFSAKIAQVLGLKVEDVDKSRPINVYGIDSLVAIDLKNWMQREVGAEMDVFVQLANLSLEELCNEAVSRSSFRKET